MISTKRIHVYTNQLNYLGITYAGNHGMEIYNADGTTFKQEMPREYYDKMHKMLNTLNTEVFMPTCWFILVIANLTINTEFKLP